MRDPRCDRLAELVVGYSLGIRPGETVAIRGGSESTPLLLALYRATLAAGAHPGIDVQLEEVEDMLLADATDDQLTFVSDSERFEAEHLDVAITLFSEGNTRRHTLVDPDRKQRRVAARRELSNLLWTRIEAGEARWCGSLFPTAGHAQDAGMSTAAYEDFVFRACHVDESEPDPAAFWKGFADELRARAKSLDPVRELRLLGDGTDLTLGLDGRTWLVGDGTMNMPDGEIFTSPVETATRGEVSFSFPALFLGREVRGIHLRFDEGRVVYAEASEGKDYLKALLAMDDGASILGEAAIGLNYGIDRFTANTLFDEKIGGTIHLAFGYGFGEAGGTNVSKLHWDIVTDLGPDGEIHADGEMVWRGGRFLP